MKWIARTIVSLNEVVLFFLTFSQSSAEHFTVASALNLEEI